MAEGCQFVCDRCGLEQIAWSDGNPYFIDALGEKQHAYHPDHDGLDRCIGNDAEHLCLACGSEFMVDSRAPRDACPACGSRRIEAVENLDGKKCPACPAGTIRRDPDWFAVS